jgi:hypothetical protein
VRRLIVLSFLLAACQSKPAVPTCDGMADHVLALFQPADAFAKDVRDVFAKRCTADHWTDDMRACIGSTETVTAPHNCKQKLPADQAKRLEDDLKHAEEAEQHRAIPPVCTRYEEVLHKVMACDKLPKDVRDGLALRFAAAKAEWATMQDKRELGSICAGGIKALKSASLDCPGAATW